METRIWDLQQHLSCSASHSASHLDVSFRTTFSFIDPESSWTNQQVNHNRTYSCPQKKGNEELNKEGSESEWVRRISKKIASNQRKKKKTSMMWIVWPLLWIAICWVNEVNTPILIQSTENNSEHGDYPALLPVGLFLVSCSMPSIAKETDQDTHD